MDMDTTSVRVERPRVKGRFLFLGDQKFFVKGVTYGPFPPDKNGDFLPAPEQVEADFRQMRESGVNTIRVYWVPPVWLLDLALKHGVWVMIGVPWPQHICFLDQWEVQEGVKNTIREAVRSTGRHPAVFCWLIGNEIPRHVVRWHGAKRLEKFLEKLYAVVKEEDPEALCSYANYPSTEYLRLKFLDFLCFNVYLHDETAFRAYLKRLQNVAEEMPLVLSEFGMDSMRHGEEAVASLLRWQLRAAFELGVSGAVVFAWTDEWFTGGHLIEDWAFGMVDAARRPKAAHTALAEVYRSPVPQIPPDPPMISVVVCAYNAASTMEGCMASFLKVTYPRFEVIVVDDGSKDTTGAIADKYVALRPDIYKVIHQPNMGLSAARNVGLYAAAGEITAYTDSDCYVDPDWLTYMAWAFTDPRFAAVGGPNLPPPEDNRIAACVAVSPGAPTHVLLSDDVAEHIPGCNMAFRTDILKSIAGFDVTYRAAGDDVDACWRLMDQGHLIGFDAGMFVWHHRRNTIKAYLKQQNGYGRAEALLAPKHHERFNALGNSRWAGRIYGDISGHTLTVRPIIYHGVFGNGLFQTLYEPRASLFSHLPLSFEWIMAAAVLAVLGPALPWFGLAGLVMLAATLVWSVNRAAFAKLPPAYDDWKSRSIIVFLTMSQPVLRGWTRYWTLLTLAKAFARVSRDAQTMTAPEPPSSIMEELAHTSLLRKLRELAGLLANHFSFHRFFWNNQGVEREALLQMLMDALRSLGFKPRIDSGFASSSETPPWDMEVRPGMWSKVQIRLTVEHHGGDKRFVRLAGSVLPTGLAKSLFFATALLTGAAVVVGQYLAGAILLAVLSAFLFWVVRDNFRGARLVGFVAQHMNLCAGSNGEDAPQPVPAQCGVAA
jgi:glycosyltransferase involved in cell wall biosynthesis